MIWLDIERLVGIVRVDPSVLGANVGFWTPHFVFLAGFD